MKNKRLALLSFLLLFSVQNFPQQQFLDAPFGGGGGFIAGWQFADVKPLNNLFKVSGMPSISESGVFTTGGGGFIYVGFIPHLRIGGMGFAGSTSETQNASGVTGFNREVEYAIGGGGFTIEYTLPFIRNIGISAGLMIGGGSIDVDIHQNTGSASWENLFNKIFIPGFGTEDRFVQLKRSYWIFTPTLTVDIPITRFVAFRAGGGYQLSVGGTWRYNNDIELSGAPSDFNGNSFFIQAGIIAGFFSF